LATVLDKFILARRVPIIEGWIALGFNMTITLLVSLLLTFYLGLSSKQRSKIIQRVRIVLAFTKDN
jgi:hypothetical protein